MTINVTKLTDVELLRKACESTFGRESKMSLDRMYKCMHSPIRTQVFWIEMIDIPTFVSVHFVRHNQGVSHYVFSNREDRSGHANAETNRLTLINHCMFINAEALINMARKRLCYQASKETRETMIEIRNKVELVDPALAKYMVPECHYRNMYCPELRPCGHYKVSTQNTNFAKE